MALNDHCPPIYPIALVASCVLVAYVTGYYWIGIVGSSAVLMAVRLWWNCPFGAAVVVWCLGGILTSSIPYAQMLRD